MKNSIHTSIIILSLCFLPFLIYCQCTPGNEEDCPDPEGNGEICPDTLAPIFTGIEYFQEVTMLAPPKIDTLDLSFDLHHITLLSVEGLPQGIDWVTNAENDEFLVGIYYCILFSGTTNDTIGTYPLKIIVDIYALILGEPVNVFTLTDSTSLSIRVLENASSIFNRDKTIFITNIRPNPFTDALTIDIEKTINGSIIVEIFNLTGTEVYSETKNVNLQSAIKLDLDALPTGLYFISLTHGKERYTKLVSKIQ